MSCYFYLVSLLLDVYLELFQEFQVAYCFLQDNAGAIPLFGSLSASSACCYANTLDFTLVLYMIFKYCLFFFLDKGFI